MSDKNRTGYIASRRIYGDTMVLGTSLTGSDQKYDQVSAVKNFLFGTKMMVGGRVFYYAMAGATVSPQMGAKVKNPQDISFQSIGGNSGIGASVITLTLSNADGPTYNGLLPKDYLQGGFVVVYPAAGPQYEFVRQIMGNSAVTVNGGTATFTVTLDRPAPVALTAADNAEAMASPYANVVLAGSTHIGVGFCSVVGVPAAIATVGQFLWLQTWGPIWVSPHANVGVADTDKAVMFAGDGSFAQGQEVTPGGVSDGLVAQRAGFVLANSRTTGQGAPFVMLQITP